MSSILDDVKLSLPMEPDDTDFDVPIIMYTNAALQRLHQLGVGDTAVSIEDRTAQWEDLFPGIQLGMIKPFVCMSVKRDFDPPTIGAVLTALNNNITKQECLIETEYDKT